MNMLTLTERDREIVETLALRVRVLSIAQIARSWFGGAADPERSAAKRLRILAEEDVVEVFTMQARPELRFERPVFEWRAGGGAPDFDKLSYRLVSRWRGAARPTPLVIATGGAATRVGGAGGRRPRRSEASHDLSLAALYLHLRQADRPVAEGWISEARLRSLGFGNCSKLPDALIRRRGEETILELGGAYPTPKLREFHGFCSERKVSYELW